MTKKTMRMSRLFDLVGCFSVFIITIFIKVKVNVKVDTP